MNCASLVTARSLKTLDLDGDGASPAGDLVLPTPPPFRRAQVARGPSTQRPEEEHSGSISPSLVQGSQAAVA